MPVDYNLGKIYKIVCNVTDEIYIGSTCQPTVAHRLAKHVQNYKRYKQGKTHNVTSFKIIERGDYNIYLIENCQCNNKDELTKREGEIIKQMQNDFTVVNKNIAGRTPAEYIVDNREKIKLYREQNKEQMKLYREQNKDKIKEQNKAYREQNKDKTKEHKKEYYKQNKDTFKEYYEQNKEKIKEHRKERIQCDCGMTYPRNNKTHHCKSNKHIKLLEQLNNVA